MDLNVLGYPSHLLQLCHPACGELEGSSLSPVLALRNLIAMQVQHSYTSSTIEVILLTTYSSRSHALRYGRRYKRPDLVKNRTHETSALLLLIVGVPNSFCPIEISEGGGKGEILTYSGVAVIWRKFLQFSSFVPEFQLRFLFPPAANFLCLLFFPSHHRNPPNSSSESAYSFLLSPGLIYFNSSDYLPSVCLLSNLLVETFDPSRGQRYSGHPCRDTTTVVYRVPVFVWRAFAPCIRLFF